MITRIGIALLMAITLAGCQKRENSQAKDVTAKDEGQSAATSPTQTPAAQVAQTKPPQTPPLAGPRRMGPDKAQQLVGLTWIKNGPVTITPGTVYVVEFWATWCPPCKITIPHLTELQKKYKDKGVVFVSVSDEPVDVVKPFVKEMGDTMDYNVACDTQGEVVKGYLDAFRQEVIPTAFVVDAVGKVVWFGLPLDEQFEKAIERAIAAKGAAPPRG